MDITIDWDVTAMYQQHEESIKNLVALFEPNPDVSAIILGGSVAKGLARPDSDIDAIIIVSGSMYSRLASQNRLSECITGHCTYEHGYFDLKYFTKKFIRAAAEKGSEPTRNSFAGSRCIFARDPQIEEIVRRIPVYPVWEKEDRLLSFYSALCLNSGYFWSEAVRDDNLYLKSRTAADIVLFGMRMLFALNEKLFPCQKWLMRFSRELEKKPDHIEEKTLTFLKRLDDESKDDFVNSILNFCTWPVPQDFTKILSRYVEDNEQWWYNGRPNIAEW